MKEKEIIIIGCGMSGLGAAHQLRENGLESKIFDKQPYFGGQTASFTKDGWTFDIGPHISFSKDDTIKALLADGVDGKFLEIKAGVNNYWQGHWIKHPAQVNLHGLPSDLVTTIIIEFIEASKKNTDKSKIKTFKEWLYASFGETFAETFPMKYGIKFHTVHADKMSIEWLGPRLYQPKMKEIVYGAVSPQSPDVHYISDFRYPEEGGYVSFLQKFKQKSDISLNSKVIAINPEDKKVTFEDGKVVNYEHLISSMPLPVIIPMIKGVPNNVLKASQELTCSNCVLVNIGIDRADILDAVWTYFYDEDIIFTRLNFPHVQSPNNVPEGCGSIQAEIYFSDKYKPLEQKPEEFVDRTIADLRKCGLIKENDKILYKETRHIEYANVIFDLDTKKNTKIVHDYLDEKDIEYCGRYGEWAYIWTDQSFRSGMNAGKKVLRKLEKNNK
jgi:protoporphyrinogen oxidase